MTAREYAYNPAFGYRHGALARAEIIDSWTNF